MYELFIANKNYSSWSLRPWLLMTQLDIPFEERLVRFAPGLPGTNREAFRKFAPNGLVPCLHDGATVVWESLGIAEYLAERHANVWPSDPLARAWARSAAAEMHGGFFGLRNDAPMSLGVRVRLHGISPTLERDIARLDELWTEGLSRFGGPFLAGADFTAVDAFFAPVAFRIRTYDLALSTPAGAYAKHLLALPALQRWESDGLAETFREPEHEKEIAALGTVVEDFRAV